MKIRTLFSKSIQHSLLIALIFLSSCKKDNGLNSSELLVYIPGEYGSVNSTITIPLTHTPVSVWGSTSVSFSAFATREVPANVDVFINPVDSLVAMYNKLNGTSYLLLPAANYKIVNGSKHTITSGKVASDSIKIEITDAMNLTDAKGFLLPLSITNIEGSDKGVKISTNQSTVYLALPYVFTNIDSTQVPVAGTVMSRTAWAVTVSGSSSGTANQPSNLLDGSNSTYWRSNSSTTAVKTVTVNMGSAQTVKGFRISPNYTSTAENATQITVSTSQDGVTYTVQGIWRGTTYASSSSTTSPDIKGINFIVPVSARYFKLDVTGWPSGGIVGMAEINGVQ